MAPPDPKGARTRAKPSASAPSDRERFDPAAANTQKAVTLRLTRLRRRARARGLTVRHSDYGYSLIDGAQDRLGGRSDLTLDEVEAHLAGA